MPTAVPTDTRSKPASRSAPIPARVDHNHASVTHIAAPLQLVPQPQQSRKLALLLKLRKISTPTALVMILGILPLYGWSVSTQLSWGKRFQHLDQLRRDERQYQTVTETLKHDLTQDAMQNPSGLVPQGPSNNLFLPEMPVRPNAPAVTTPAVQPNPALSAPLAY
jgi:hypothetical protein